MPEVETFYERVRKLGRDQFAAAHSHLFLLGTQALTKPMRPMHTVSIDFAQLQDYARRHQAGEVPPPGPASAPAELPKVYAVTKVQPNFPSMISVGRTNNNDILIEDVQVSKFHACFRVKPEGLELEDMGSRNGTKVGAAALAKGTPQRVRPGDTIGLGALSFELCDAGTLWDRLRTLPRGAAP